MHSWSPTSWQHHLYEQSANYPDQAKLEQVVQQLSQLPPLVTSSEIDRLKHSIASAGRVRRLFYKAGIVLNHLMIAVRMW